MDEHKNKIVSLVESMLTELRIARNLPPVEEFTVDAFVQSYSEDLSDLLTRKKLRHHVDDYLNNTEAAVWSRLHRILLGRARAQVVSWGEWDCFEVMEEVAQTTLMKVKKGAANFVGRTDREFYAWLYTTHDRSLIDFMRKRRRADVMGSTERRISIDAAALNWSTCCGIVVPISKEESPSHVACQQETVEALYCAISQLTDVEQKVLLARMADQTFDQVAHQLKLPRSTVYRHYHNALTTLRERLGADE